ncbi:hypothetical protein DPMN_128963 [Dreissena polymorpha]|uniref:Uncharacterized protein n=1 Tax=Dreissena polymorpha TaxID=45954 RepID=A0A9D4H1U3_DREPO|nr:hypothetical protein DPMN_128963 [Dreissena polymorpha]
MEWTVLVTRLTKSSRDHMSGRRRGHLFQPYHDFPQITPEKGKKWYKTSLPVNYDSFIESTSPTGS